MSKFSCRTLFGFYGSNVAFIFPVDLIFKFCFFFFPERETVVSGGNFKVTIGLFLGNGKKIVVDCGKWCWIVK